MTKHKTITGDRIVTPVGRVSYPSVFEPDTGGQYSDGKYKIELIFDKTNKEVVEGVRKLRAAVTKVAKEAFGKTVTLKDIRHPFNSGDDKIENNPAYENSIYIRAKSKYKPEVVDAAVQPIIEPGEFYAGCQAVISVVPFSYVAGKDRGVSFRLGNVQKVADDEPFGVGGVKADEDFEALEAVAEEEGVPFDGVEDDDDDGDDGLGLF